VDPKTVRKLEKELYEAIADVICRMGLQKLPLLPSQHTMEMMAKAAAAVYEAAEENHRRPLKPPSP
jgi:MinD-like ATPase involved in chromosome partitioning or flagellar assembly